MRTKFYFYAISVLIGALCVGYFTQNFSKAEQPKPVSKTTLICDQNAKFVVVRNIKHEIIAYLPCNTEVLVQDTQQEFILVQLSNFQGFVRSSNISEAK